MKNQGFVVEALLNIQKLNVAWAGDQQMMASELAGLQATVTALTQKK